MDSSKFLEEKVLLSTLMAQRADIIRELLGSVGLPRSGTKEELEERLRAALRDADITPDQIVHALDRVEAWGRQHVFLYNAPTRIPSEFKSRSGFQATLKNAGWDVTLNEPSNLMLPSSKTVRLISLSDRILRIEWVEARRWTERLKSLDYTEVVNGEEIIFQAAKPRLQRAISAFEWNFDAQTAELFIYRLPSGTRYSAEEIAFRALLKPIVDLDYFETVRMKRALARLKDSSGIRERRTNYIAPNGAKLSMQSADRATTLSAERELQEIRDLIKQSKKYGAAFLNCFWEPDAELSDEVHTHIDSFEARVGFLGQCSEEAVRYVLQRIRKAAR
jgi:hypothetical protein